MSSRKLTIVFSIVVLIAACATVAIKRPRVDLAKHLNFSHQKHVEEADCSDCHEGVAESTGPTRGAFIGVGEHGGCQSCHEDEIDEKKCGMCHLGKDKKIELTRIDRHLRFSHAAHANRAKNAAKDCKQCHPAVTKATKPGVVMVPDMAQCATACHQQDMFDMRCDKCHSDLQKHPLAAVGQFTHQGDFVKRHGMLAKNSAGETCATCHDQTHCADCHARTADMPNAIRFPERVEARFIHRGDWLGRHASVARMEPMSCKKCHGPEHCSSCHKLSGVAPSAAGPVPKTTLKVHGPDFMTPGAAGFHGRAARRAAGQCATCHDQGGASNCVECHRVGELGGNPHPNSFKWRNKSGECRSNRMCATCHMGGSGCP